MIDDAKYLREQAILCLEMARQISVNADADEMRQQASEYSARAARLEEAESRDKQVFNIASGFDVLRSHRNVVGRLLP
jgi:hypothetical protein